MFSFPTSQTLLVRGAVVSLAVGTTCLLFAILWKNTTITGRRAAGCQGRVVNPLLHSTETLPGGRSGWRVRVQVTPKRFPCYVQWQLTKHLDDHWLCVGARAEELSPRYWRIGQGQDGPLLVYRLELADGQIGRQYTFWPIYVRRK